MRTVAAAAPLSNRGVVRTMLLQRAPARRIVDTQLPELRGKVTRFRYGARGEAPSAATVASPNCCKSPGLSRARRRFPQVLTRRLKEDLRRETHGTAVGGDRGTDRHAACRRGRREPARGAV